MIDRHGNLVGDQEVAWGSSMKTFCGGHCILAATVKTVIQVAPTYCKRSCETPGNCDPWQGLEAGLREGALYLVDGGPARASLDSARGADQPVLLLRKTPLC